MKKSKRYKEAFSKVDQDKAQSIEDAVDILKGMPRVKFDETVEISCKLGADPKQSDQVVRGSVVLPHGTGKAVRVLVFCEPEKEAAAKESGAEYAGGEQARNKCHDAEPEEELQYYEDNAGP